jgi:hypothetical protein
MRPVSISLLLGAALCAGASASAFSPGPNARITLLPLGCCQGGAQHSKPCFDHFQQADVLASVRRTKATIRAILPADPP